MAKKKIDWVKLALQEIMQLVVTEQVVCDYEIDLLPEAQTQIQMPSQAEGDELAGYTLPNYSAVVLYLLELGFFSQVIIQAFSRLGTSFKPKFWVFDEDRNLLESGKDMKQACYLRVSDLPAERMESEKAQYYEVDLHNRLVVYLETE